MVSPTHRSISDSSVPEDRNVLVLHNGGGIARESPIVAEVAISRGDAKEITEEEMARILAQQVRI